MQEMMQYHLIYCLDNIFYIFPFILLYFVRILLENEICSINNCIILFHQQVVEKFYFKYDIFKRIIV